MVEVIDKAWEKRDCVEVFTKEDEREQQSFLVGQFNRNDSILDYVVLVLAGLVFRSPAQ